MNGVALLSITGGLLLIGVGLLNSFLLARPPRSRVGRWWYNPEFAEPRLRRSHHAANATAVLLGLSSLLNGLQYRFRLLGPSLEIVLVILPSLAIACLLAAIVFRVRSRRS